MNAYCPGYEVTTLEDCVSRAHLFVTATGCCDIIKPEHLLKMREDAIVCNIGHFDCEIDSSWLKTNCQRSEIKPQVSCYGNAVLIWLCVMKFHLDSTPPLSSRLTGSPFPMAVM